jgi:YebC/PmpR family DNA-binding regulatory protein
MAGHSHWAKVKRTKGVLDARRGREWSKLARRVIVAAKGGGGNPDENLQLRYAIDECKAANMPKDTIEKAIKKGTGELGAASYEPAVYEGYGPGGVAFMVECLTDNRARTAPEMRNIFERGGGQLGASNCVAWMFEQKGRFIIPAAAIEEDALMELAIEAGADDVRRDGDEFEVLCAPPQFAAVRDALAAKGLATTEAKLVRIPKTTVAVGADRAQQLIRLMEAFEDNDDVQNAWANFDIPDDVMSRMAQ